jgi:hypothetical protein
VVSFLLRQSVGEITLVLIDTNTLVVLEVTSHESVLVRVLAHAETSNSDAVQVQLIAARARMLGLLLRNLCIRHLAGRTRVGHGGSHGQVVSGLAEIDVTRGIGDINGGVYETVLQGDHVVTQAVVFIENSLHLLTESVDVLVLSFQLANIGFLALAESTL